MLVRPPPPPTRWRGRLRHVRPAAHTGRHGAAARPGHRTRPPRLPPLPTTTADRPHPARASSPPPPPPTASRAGALAPSRSGSVDAGTTPGTWARTAGGPGAPGTSSLAADGVDGCTRERCELPAPLEGRVRARGRCRRAGRPRFDGNSLAAEWPYAEKLGSPSDGNIKALPRGSATTARRRPQACRRPRCRLENEGWSQPEACARGHGRGRSPGPGGQLRVSSRVAPGIVTMTRQMYLGCIGHN